MEEKFSVGFGHEVSPYFQAAAECRIPIPFQHLKRSVLRRSVIVFLFGGDSRLDLTFFKSYAAANSHRFCGFEKQSLHGAVDIRNWREQVVLKQEDNARLVFVTIQDISKYEVLAYIQSIARGKRPSFIAFYNDRYLLTVDDEECVVISKNREDLHAVRNLILQTDKG